MTSRIDMEGLSQRRSQLLNDATALIDDIKSEMNAETSSHGKLIFLKKKSLIENCKIRKEPDNKTEELD